MTRRFARRAALAAAATVLGLWVALKIALRFVPLPVALFEPLPASVELVDRHGIPLREIRPEKGFFGTRSSFEQLPQTLVDATLAAEDKRFWDHHGVDWRASFRALAGLIKNRRVISGGSTLTQQLIKLAEPRSRTFRTKLIEAVQAMRLEQIWSKRRILAEYVSRLDYGNLVTGPREAAEYYFGKPLGDLSLAEAALLAGLPQSPSRLNPRVRFEQARKRQHWILARLAQNGKYSASERDRAQREELRLTSGNRVFEAPHFVDLLLQTDPVVHANNPAVVRTTLDLQLNRFVEHSLRQQLETLRRQNVHDGAVVVLDNASGDVLALVGSGDYRSAHAGQVNGAWAPRSAGSTLKPFTYLLALERGATPASVVDDLPVEFPTATGVFAPENYNRRCYGPMRYRLALANSLNISAVKVLQSVGGAAILQERLQALGITTLTKSPDHYGLGLTLGNAEVRLVEVVNAYAALARLGEFRAWTLTPAGDERIRGRGTGKEKETRRPPLTSPSPSLTGSQTASWLIADILHDNDARSLAFGNDSSLRFEFPVACKTGTSSDFRDNWAIGFTPEFTVGVWMGNFDGTSMRGVSGVSGAAPVLHEVFEHLHDCFGTSWYPPPRNIVQRSIHRITGKILARDCPEGVHEKFGVADLPLSESPGDYDAMGRVRLPLLYRAWLASGDNWLGAKAVVDPGLVTGSGGLRLVSPQPGTIFLLDPNLPESSRAIPLRAEGAAELRWESDSLECRQTPSGAVAVMREGKHKLRVVGAAAGERVETWVMVKAL